MRAMQQKISDRANASSFPKKDARDACLYRVCQAINVYCFGVGTELTARELREHVDAHDDVLALTQRAFGNTGRTNVLTFYRARRRAHLFLDVWNAFEDPLRIIDAAVVPATERAKDDGEHAGIPTVWKRVSRVAKASAQATPDQRGAYFDTVKFWSSARNTIHSNTVYSGTSTNTLVLPSGFRPELVPGKPTSFMEPSHMPLLIQPLIDAWEYLRAGITQNELIAMPASIDESAYD